jgi:hypothetical protein
VCVVGVTGVVIAVVIARERSRERSLIAARRKRQLARMPKNLDEVARRRAAEARAEKES